MGNGVDYFPLDVTLDDKLELTEAEFGLTGFAVVVKLFQKIYGGQGYYCEWNDEVALLFSRKIGLGGNAVSEIVSASVKRGIFDKTLYEKYKILTSSGIQKRYFKAVSRRKSVEVEKQYLLCDCAQFLKNVDIFYKNGDIFTKNANTIEQSKRKDSKEEDSKEEDSKENKELVVIVSEYEKNIAPISSIIVEKIEEWLKEVDSSLIMYALEQAVLKNKKSWSYINGVINNCYKSGKKTRADAENKTEQKKSARKGTYELDDMAAVERKIRLERMNNNA